MMIAESSGGVNRRIRWICQLFTATFHAALTHLACAQAKQSEKSKKVGKEIWSG